MNKTHHGVFGTSAIMERVGSPESGSMASNPGSDFSWLHDAGQIVTLRFQVS